MSAPIYHPPTREDRVAWAHGLEELELIRLIDLRRYSPDLDDGALWEAAMDRGLVPLDYDTVEALGLDGSGIDAPADHDPPYTLRNLPITQLILLLEGDRHRAGAVEEVERRLRAAEVRGVPKG